MRFDDVHLNNVQGNWTHLNHEVDLSDVSVGCESEVCGAFNPYLELNIKDCHHLNETTYKELAILVDPQFLNQKLRADQLSGIRLQGFEENLMNFDVPSSKQSENRITYVNSILFDDWEEIGSDPDFDMAERARMLLWVGNIKVHCSCPSFLYWGYQYLCTVMDAAIYPEKKAPGKYENEPRRRRNVNQKGIVCKHLNRVLRILPFHSGDIAKELGRQFG